MADPFADNLFDSIQPANGVDVVLVPHYRSLASSPADALRVGLKKASLEPMSTFAIGYRHESLRLGLDDDDEAWIAHGFDERVEE